MMLTERTKKERIFWFVLFILSLLAAFITGWQVIKSGVFQKRPPEVIS